MEGSASKETVMERLRQLLGVSAEFARRRGEPGLHGAADDTVTACALGEFKPQTGRDLEGACRFLDELVIHRNDAARSNPYRLRGAGMPYVSMHDGLRRFGTELKGFVRMVEQMQVPQWQRKALWAVFVEVHRPWVSIPQQVFTSRSRWAHDFEKVPNHQRRRGYEAAIACERSSVDGRLAAFRAVMEAIVAGCWTATG